MKLLLLKTLLQRRERDEGFTLPIVIALGLIMTLLGLVNIISASEENLTAIAKNSSSDSLAVAEIGVARYRELLDTNRILALYNLNRWTGVGANNVFGIDNVCSADIATFADTTNWHDVILSEANAGADFNRDGDQTDTVNMGQYRLVSYIYDIDGDLTNEDARVLNPGALPANQIRIANFSQTDDKANTDDDFAFNDTAYDPVTSPNGYNPKGILTVQGRTEDGGAMSQIEVEIPIRINQQDMNNLAPALWIGDGDTSNLGNLELPDGIDADTLSDTNIVVTAPTDGTTAGCADPADDGNNVIISDPRSIPPIQSVVDTITTAQTDNGDQTNSTITSRLGRPADSTTDKPYVKSSDGNSFVDYANKDSAGNWDCSNIRDCRYYYDLGSTTIDTDVETDGIARVTLYIDGDLTINNGADIGSSISSSYLEIYVTGNVTINTAGDPTVISALIHAPTGTLTINNSGNVTFNGSVWVNTFVNNTTGTVTIDPDNTSSSSDDDDRSYEFYTTTSSRIPRPLTASPTDWKTEEVTP